MAQPLTPTTAPGIFINNLGKIENQNVVDNLSPWQQHSVFPVVVSEVSSRNQWGSATMIG